MGVGMRLRYLWLFLWLLCVPALAQAAWFRVETPNFIFYGTSPQSLKEDALRLERFDAFLRQRFGLPTGRHESKLLIYVLSSRAAIAQVYGGDGRDLGGFYTSNATGPTVVLSPVSAPDAEDVVLFHEYAHHLMLQYFPVAYPVWYVEGFAELYATARFRRDRILLGLPANHRAFDLLLSQTTPIATLLTASVADLPRAKVGNFYGRAWLLTHMLNFTPSRAGQLTAYISAINKGTPPLAAAQQAFGDLDALQKDMARHLEARTTPYVSAVSPVPQDLKIDVAQLSPSFGATVLDRLRLLHPLSPEERTLILGRLYQAATHYPQDAELWALIAYAELQGDNTTASAVAADKAIALHPSFARALLWRGLADLRALGLKNETSEEAWKMARSWVVRANRADTEDPLPLFEYYRSFRRAGQKPSAVAVQGLAKATALLPQADRFRFAYAYELAQMGKFNEAAAYFRPSANAPHGGNRAQHAQLLIVELEKAAKGAANTLSHLQPGVD